MHKFTCKHIIVMLDKLLDKQRKYVTSFLVFHFFIRRNRKRCSLFYLAQ